jgi:hypothetical protein
VSFISCVYLQSVSFIALSVIKWAVMGTIAGFSHYTVSPPPRIPRGYPRMPRRGPSADGAVPLAPLRCLERAVCREDALPYGSAATRLPRGRRPRKQSGPAMGDWLSGRAPRSHRGGHWFDPSIAHRCKSRSQAPRIALILRCGWELSPYWEEFGRSCFPPGRGAARADARGAERGCGQADMTARWITAW